MLQAGLFNDPETGRLNRRMLNKIYEMLEMGNWESGLGVDELHIRRSQRENIFLDKKQSHLKCGRLTMMKFISKNIHGLCYQESM